MRFTWPVILVVAACQSGLDREKLDGEIVSTLKEKGVDATVDCPEVKRLVEGTKFQCTGIAFGKHFNIDVSVTDGKGTVRWDLVGKIVETKKLADFVSPQIAKKLDSPVQVSCADKQAILAPGDSITCDVTVGDQRGHVGITVAANGDDVTWEILK
jgi:Domain of unknown function (DUF4333)